MILMRSFAVPVASAAVALCPAQAHAQTHVQTHARLWPEVVLTWDAGNNDARPLHVSDERGLWRLDWNVVSSTGEGAATGASFLVTAILVVTNPNTDTQNFSLLMTFPVDEPMLNPSVRGSVVGTAIDGSLDGVTVSAPLDDRIYTPRIDGVDEAAGFLMAYPFSTGPGGAFGVQEFGPVIASQDIDDSVALRLTFDLTSFDSLSLLATFEVTANAADLNGDGSVCILDFLQLLAAWGPCTGCPEDLDGDQFVGINDMLELLANWGQCSSDASPAP